MNAEAVSNQLTNGFLWPVLLGEVSKHLEVFEVKTWANTAAHQGIRALAASSLPASCGDHLHWLCYSQLQSDDFIVIWI